LARHGRCNTGKARAAPAVMKDGPGLSLWDENGNIIWSAIK